MVELFSNAVNSLIENLEVLKKFELDDELKNKVEQFLEIITNSKNIFIYGVGRSGLVGKAFAMRLMHLGLNSYFVGESTCPAIKKGDSLIVISCSGETSSVVNVLKKVQDMNKESKNIKTVSITRKCENTVEKLSDLWIPLEILNKKDFPMGTLFEEISLIFLDIVTILLMKKLGISEEEMKKNHNNLQ